MRAIEEENPVRPWRALLRVCFEDLLAIGTCERMETVSVQGRVAKIGLEQAESFSHLLENAGFRVTALQLLEISPGFGCEKKLTTRHPRIRRKSPHVQLCLPPLLSSRGERSQEPSDCGRAMLQ